MAVLRLATGSATVFFMLMAVSASGLQFESGAYHILKPEDAALVRGEGGGLSPSPGGSGSSPVNIPLSHVPYVTQYLNESDSRNTSQKVSRSPKYCDIASVLMMLAKNEKNSSTVPILYDSSKDYRITVPMYTTASHRFVDTSELITIKGGSSVASLPTSTPSIGGGGKGGSSGSSNSVHISLSNVPYITQRLNPYDNRNTSQKVSRSPKYCGIASALMVRAKNGKNFSSIPILYDSSKDYNYWEVDTDMKKIDDYLLNGEYGSTIKRVDVLANQGLLYIDMNLSDTAKNWESQYVSTVGILEGVYTGKLGGIRSKSDSVSVGSQYVTSVSMRPISASLKSGNKEISEATKAIWDHIKNYRQPVVVVVDSNKQLPYSNNVQSSWDNPTLHYIVIKGISEDSSGGTRHFVIYDPMFYSENTKYTEANLRKLMALPDNTPAWVYKYGYREVGSDPAYILTVQGD